MSLRKDRPQHASDLETYLKSFQPCEADVDLHTVQLLAADNDAHQNLQVTPPRNWQVISASWLCGAAVGAACMFCFVKPVQQALEQQVITEKPVKTTEAERANALTFEPEFNAIVAENKPNSKLRNAIPDLIAFARSAQLLRPQINLDDTDQPGLDGLAMSNNRQKTTVAADTNSSNFTQKIQLPESNTTTRQSLLQELLLSNGNS